MTDQERLKSQNKKLRELLRIDGDIFVRERELVSILNEECANKDRLIGEYRLFCAAGTEAALAHSRFEELRPRDNEGKEQ